MTAATWSTLPNWRFRLVRRDTRSVITCVFLGLTITVMLQIIERIDLALTGGSIPIIASMVVVAIWVPASAFYGLTGALITAWINPLISNLTASQPMAPFLFFTNAAHTIPIVLLVWALKPRSRGLRLWEFLAIAQVGALADAAVFGLGNHVIMHLPSGFIVFQALAMQPCALAGGFITYVMMRRLLKTGLVETARWGSDAEEPV